MTKGQFLEQASKITKAVDKELDWFCAYISETDPAMKKLAYEKFLEKKQLVIKEIEEYERRQS